MKPFNPDKCRFIKNKANCWEVYADTGEHLITSFPNLKKDAVKSLIKFAAECYSAGIKHQSAKGNQNEEIEDAAYQGKIIGRREMKTELMQLLSRSFPEHFPKSELIE
ncbi:hypothetical protein ACP3V3_01960 [Vibrio sp. PNB22_3_1]